MAAAAPLRAALRLSTTKKIARTFGATAPPLPPPTTPLHFNAYFFAGYTGGAEGILRRSVVGRRRGRRGWGGCVEWG